MKRDKAAHQAIMLCIRHYFFYLSKLNSTQAFPLAYQYSHKIQGCLVKLRGNSCTVTFSCMLSWCHMALCKLFFFSLFKDWSTKRITPAAYCSPATAVAHISLSHQPACPNRLLSSRPSIFSINGNFRYIEDTWMFTALASPGCNRAPWLWLGQDFTTAPFQMERATVASHRESFDVDCLPFLWRSSA